MRMSMHAEDRTRVSLSFRGENGREHSHLRNAKPWPVIQHKPERRLNNSP